MSSNRIIAVGLLTTLIISILILFLYHDYKQSSIQEVYLILNENDSLKAVIEDKEDTIQKREDEIRDLLRLEKLRQIISFQNKDLHPWICFEIARTIDDSARKYNHDVWTLAALIAVESSYDPYAVSSANAIGLMQIKPSTAKYVCDMLDICWDGKDRLFDWVYNIKVGSAYLYILRNIPEMYRLEAYAQGPNGVNPNDLWYTERIRKMKRFHNDI